MKSPPPEVEPAATALPAGPIRWWIYQRERFPLVQHAPLIAVFSYAALCFARLLTHDGATPLTLPGWRPAAVAFLGCLGFFMQLRIADEHKDFEEDARYRPYRAVPRGLIRLRELALLGVVIAAIQAITSSLLAPELLIVLLVAWIYFALMSKEFFARAWLVERPVLYLLSHMGIMPLIDLFATACDWIPAGAHPPLDGLLPFLGASYLNGVVIEIGRKIRAPEDEETGVRTYTVLWGRRTAVGAWLAALVGAALGAVLAARAIDAVALVGTTAAFAVTISAFVAWRFLRHPAPGRGARFELLSGLWIIVLYLALGIAPAILRVLG